MLLTIEHFSRNFSSDVIGNVITQDERDLLAFLQMDVGYNTLSNHTILLNLLEGHGRACGSVLLTMINCDI